MTSEEVSTVFEIAGHARSHSARKHASIVFGREEVKACQTQEELARLVVGRIDEVGSRYPPGTFWHTVEMPDGGYMRRVYQEGGSGYEIRLIAYVP